MNGPISDRLVDGLGRLPGAAKPQPSSGAPGDDFAGVLREQLERVSQMQSEADENLQRLLTGQTQNVTEVFVATRKAGVAFSLLMEIRNKLVDAYEELKNLRV
jgi:flagellar hook-basal body complex protein FliE